jgi:putative transposase
MCFFAVEAATRRVYVLGVTAYPAGEWVAQQARNLLAVFDAVFAAAGIEVLRTPIRAPRANAYAERWVGTVRRELFDRILIFGHRHLQSVIREYVDHYNSHRPHRSLGQAPPLGPAQPPVAVVGARVVRRDRVGGLIGEYSQAA